MCDSTPPKHTRREFVVTSAGSAAAMLGMSMGNKKHRPHPSGYEAQRPHLETATNVARWIESSRIETADGVTWPADPLDPSTVGSTLYTHSPGVVLFLLELYRATGDSAYLERARRGADHLMAQPFPDNGGGAGFYTGVSGLLFCFEETFRASGRAEYRDGSKRCVDWLHEMVTEAGSGVTWNGVTDIVSGSSGIGLTLLYANRMMEDNQSTELAELAELAGRNLLDLARPEAGGLKWPMADEYPRLMPNFSHGTAGVAYFLASLYEVTGDREFLDAAISGATYLQAVARVDGNTFSVFHNEPDGLDLHYLSWCHGPPGTARLFYKLADVADDDAWMDWVHRAAAALMESGIPERQTPGFWNNVSQCCGHVGAGEFFVALCRLGEWTGYRDFVQRVTSDLLRRASEDAKGVSWTQAEHRTRPEFLVAQTGYMQGAAGVGSYFLHLDALDRGAAPALRFPDAPY